MKNTIKKTKMPKNPALLYSRLVNPWEYISSSDFTVLSLFIHKNLRLKPSPTKKKRFQIIPDRPYSCSQA